MASLEEALKDYLVKIYLPESGVVRKDLDGLFRNILDNLPKEGEERKLFIESIEKAIVPWKILWPRLP